MAADVSIEIYGVRDALKELGKLDKKYRFQAQNRMKAAGAPLAAMARETYPQTIQVVSALEGWTGSGRTGYDKGRVDKGVQIQIGGRSYGNAYAIVTLVSKDPAGALFDIAGLRNGSAGKPGGPDRNRRKRQPIQSEAFLAALNSEFGKAQRGVWRRQKMIRERATQELMRAIEEIAASANRKLVQ